MRKPPRKDDYGKLSEDMPKQEAIDRVNQRYRPGKLNNDNTHFANINHGDDVWWLDIPLKKVRVPAAEDSLIFCSMISALANSIICEFRRYFLETIPITRNYLLESARTQSICICRLTEPITNSFKMSRFIREACTLRNSSNTRHSKHRRAILRKEKHGATAQAGRRGSARRC